MKLPVAPLPTQSDPPSGSASFHGILFMLLAMALAPLMDGTAKYLAQTISPVEVSMGRFFAQVLVVVALALAAKRSLSSIVAEFTRMQFIRGMFLAICSLFFFTSLKFMPLADAIAIFFVQPMILTVLSAVFLKEQVGVRRWAAVVVGMIGALVIIRPGTDALGWPALLPLAAATCFAVYLAMTRRLSGSASLLGIQFATGVAGVVTLAPIVLVASLLDVSIASWTTPNMEQLPLFLFMGVISFAGHGCIVLAFDRAPASVLAPLSYTEIISATLVGFVMFGDVPDVFVWLGVALIAGGGMYIAHRERVVSKRLRAKQAAQNATNT